MRMMTTMTTLEVIMNVIQKMTKIADAMMKEKEITAVMLAKGVRERNAAKSAARTKKRTMMSVTVATAEGENA